MKKKKNLSLREEEDLFWRTHFNIHGINEVPEHVVHLNLKEADITDEQLLYIVTRIRSIDMLDLYYTTIGNEGIRHLAILESLKELRLKGNTAIDNGCMPYISQIKNLEFLHVRHTAVNVDGLKELFYSSNLKTVLVSDDDSQDNIDIKMMEITTAMPHCEFSINNIIYMPKQPWELL